MRPRIVRTVFGKELREMLRDRRSMVIMFGIPLVLYPMLALAISSLSSTRMSEIKATAYAVAVINGQDAPILVHRLGHPELFRPKPGQSEKENQRATGIQVGLKVVSPTDPDAALAAGEIEAVIEVPADAQRQAIEGKDIEYSVRVDRSRTSTGIVEQKIRDAFYAYEQWIIQQRLAARGVNSDVLAEVRYTSRDIASGEARLGRHLAQMLPMLLLITGMVGALFPALHATTAERELGTLETLLVSPASRMELLVAKGGLVLLSGLLTAGINMLSMSLVLWYVMSSQQIQPQGVQISLLSLALSFLAAVPGLIFFTTVVLIVGLVSRNFREANAFVTPVMLLPMGAVAISILEPTTTPGLLITPVANTAIIIRDVLTGHGTWPPYLLAFASSCVYAGLMLSVAARLFSNEQLVNPAWEPLSIHLLWPGTRSAAMRGRPRRLPAVDEAIALCALALLLMFYLSPTAIRLGGLWGVLALNDLFIFGGLTVLFAWLGRYRWRETFLLRRCRAGEIAAAAMIGGGVIPVVELLRGLQLRVWPLDIEKARQMTDLLLPWISGHPVLTALGVGALAGTSEELLFRGPVQTALSRRFPAWFGISAAAFLFAAIHVDFHGLWLRWLLGILLGFVAWRSASIAPAMLLHGVYDAAQLLRAGWQVRNEGEAAVRSLDLPPLLSPRTGVELLVGLLLLIVGVLLFARTWRNRRGTHPPNSATPAPTVAPTR